MFKPKDNDIFNTKAVVCHPGVTDESRRVDPNEVFQRRTNDNYQKYASKVPGMRATVTKQMTSYGKVNEDVNFDETYHKAAKEKSLQSSIFYPPRQKQTKHEEGVMENTSLFWNKSAVHSGNFGKKETMRREINHLEINNGLMKGNSSRLFDMDERIQGLVENQEDCVPLIPYGMQWDQHDSGKYAHLNHKDEKVEEKCKSEEKECEEKTEHVEKVEALKEVNEPQAKIEEPVTQTKPTTAKA